MNDAIYRFAPQKAFGAIHWMVSQGEDVDLHAALKACYFADKSHINAHHQPIFGATYKAMKFGPVPLEIYEIMKGEALWLWEVGAVETPWILDGHRLVARANSLPDMDEFAESEFEHLQNGFHKSVDMTFTARTAATHGFDWQVAMGGRMRYEDMIEKQEKRDQVIAYIQETASNVRL